MSTGRRMAKSDRGGFLKMFEALEEIDRATATLRTLAKTFPRTLDLRGAVFMLEDVSLQIRIDAGLLVPSASADELVERTPEQAARLAVA